jgi:transposase
MYYIGLDVHKRTISYCMKDGSGVIHAQGTIPATRLNLDLWMKTLPQPWSAAMEATVFTGWIYDHLQPHAAALKVAHPLMLRTIAAAKKKNDRIDAQKICDCLRRDFLPECYMASTAIRERRRTLRYRNLLVRLLLGPGRAQTANGSLVLSQLGTTAERPTHAAKKQKEITPALLRSASGELLPS